MRGGDILESVVNECIVSHVSPGVSVTAVGVVSRHEHEIVVAFDVVVFVNNARVARKLPWYDVMDLRVQTPSLPRRAETRLAVPARERGMKTTHPWDRRL